MAVIGKKGIVYFFLILVFLILLYLMKKTNEGFQVYDVDKNISDIKYFMSLGLNPNSNTSYKNALDLYKTNMGKDFDVNDTNPKLKSTKLKTPIQPNLS